MTEKDIPIYAPQKSLRDRLKERRQLETILTTPTRFSTIVERLSAQPRQQAFVVDAVKDAISQKSEIDIASRISDPPELKEIVTTYVQSDIPSRNQQMVIDMLQGMSLKEIAEKYGTAYKSLTRIFGKERKKLEKEILFPFELKRLSRNPDIPEHLVRAGYEGSLDTFEVLNMKYFSQKQRSEYDAISRSLNPDLLNEGYQLLNQIATESEYEAIRRNPYYSDKIIHDRHHLYINPQDLGEFRKIYQPRKSPGGNPTQKRTISEVRKARGHAYWERKKLAKNQS